MIFNKFYIFRLSDVPQMFYNRKYVRLSDWSDIVKASLTQENLNCFSGFIFRHRSLGYAVVVAVKHDLLDELYRLIPEFYRMIQLPDELEFQICNLFRINHSHRSYENIPVYHYMITQVIENFKVKSKIIEDDDDITANYCR